MCSYYIRPLCVTDFREGVEPMLLIQSLYQALISHCQRIDFNTLDLSDDLFDHAFLCQSLHITQTNVRP